MVKVFPVWGTAATSQLHLFYHRGHGEQRMDSIGLPISELAEKPLKVNG